MQMKKTALTMAVKWAMKKSPSHLATMDFFDLATQASLIVLTKSNTMFRFSHQLIMEYFAAEALSSRLNKLNKYISAPFVRNRRRISTSWDEVAHMTVGLIDSDEFIARLALYDPLLAVDCLEHTSRDYSIKKETLEILIINLVMLFKSI